MIKPKANTVNDVILSLCSVMAPLIAEYDRHINDMTVQLKKYQVNEEIFQQVTQTYKYTKHTHLFLQEMCINICIHEGRFHNHLKESLTHCWAL